MHPRRWGRARVVDQAKSVTILGSTGSVGTSTLDLVRRDPEAFDVVALTANRNVELVVQQAAEFKPQMIAMADAKAAEEVKDQLSDSSVQVLSGPEGLIEAAAAPSDWVMAAIVGAAGLPPTLAAVDRGVSVALANKECLVCAGDLMMQRVREKGATLLPVDSEHNAIFQVFETDQVAEIEKIILTASGGPFRTWNHNQMGAATPEQAVAHPNWDMGAKISVDSASMMNKGLELIEAHHLFAMPEEQIDIVVHPQSVIHSMVAYTDGSVLAQMGTPDMRTPIAVTLGWPDRMPAPSPKLNFAETSTLTFEEPDLTRFPCLRLAREALQAGGAAPTVLNAANEVAVAAFLANRIGFLDIPDVVERTLAQISPRKLATLDEVNEADAEARQAAQALTESVAAAE